MLRATLAAGILRVVVAAVMFIALTAPTRARPQTGTTTPTFRTSVDAIEIDAVVTDAQGNPVTDLTAEDFEILEDGVAQRIQSFALVNIATDKLERPLFSAAPIEPDVATNAMGEGRVYLIALDEMDPMYALRARLFLRRFIEQHLGTNDVAGVVFLGRQNQRETQPLTNNPRLIIRAIDTYSGGFGGSGALAPALDSASPGQRGANAAGGQALARSEQLEAEMTRRMTASNLRQSVEFLARVGGRRKALLFVSQSIALDPFAIIDNNGGVLSLGAEEAHGAITAATRNNVAIYVVDPTGLSPDGALGDAEQPLTADAVAGMRRGRDNLRALASITGGFAIGVDSNSFGSGFERLVRENSSYYLLGFTSTNERRDGRYRRLQVRVTRAGLQVRTRDGYLAPRSREREAPARRFGALSASASEALASAMSVPGIPLDVFAGPYRGAGNRATVALAMRVDASRLGLIESEGVFKGKLEIGYLAVDTRNKVVPGEYQVLDLALRRESFERAGRDGLAVVSQITLAPGRYQLRFTVGNAGDRAGSTIHDVEVPDFTKGRLMMSAITLTTDTPPMARMNRNDALRDILPGTPTATRSFTTADTIAFFAEVYENERNARPHDVEITAELRAEGGRAVRATSERRSSSELQGGRGGYGFTSRFPLNDLPSGLYVLHIEAQSTLGDRPSARRDVLIRIAG